MFNTIPHNNFTSPNKNVSQAAYLFLFTVTGIPIKKAKCKSEPVPIVS